MSCYFIELPTRECVDKIMYAVDAKANYFQNKFIDIWRCGTSSYFETDQRMYKCAYQYEAALRSIKKTVGYDLNTYRNKIKELNVPSKPRKTINRRMKRYNKLVRKRRIAARKKKAKELAKLK